MALGTFDNSPPPFFRQGASALSKLVVFIALGLFLMVSDARWGLTDYFRMAVQTILRPIESVLEVPGGVLAYGSSYLMGMSKLRQENEALRAQLMKNSIKVQTYDNLFAENQRMRSLLDLKEYQTIQIHTASQIIKKIPDSYSEKVLLDKGLSDGVQPGSSVIGPFGVIGQVTRVFPFSSEATLVTDRTFVIAVMNARTQERGVAFGSPYGDGSEMELRFVLATADMQVGDVLMTSGIDGVYPAGLHVAKISKIERRVNSTFAKVQLAALGKPTAGRQVLILKPVQLHRDEGGANNSSHLKTQAAPLPLAPKE